MTAAWLFLYVGGLVHLLAVYGLAFDDIGTLVVFLPMVLLPLPVLLKRHRPRLFAKVPERAVACLGLAGALVFLRGLNLGIWESHRLPASCMLAAMGLTAFWITLARPHLEDGGAVWVCLGLWQLTGMLNPGLPLAGVSIFAFLAAFRILPPAPRHPCPASAPRAFPAALLLGLALAKPWWDYAANDGWAPCLAAWGLGVALAYLSPLRRAGARLGMSFLHLGLAAFFIAYTPELGWLWGILLGIMWGWVWQRLSRPLAVLQLTYGLTLGFCLSFALHANLQIPGLRHILWLGN